MPRAARLLVLVAALCVVSGLALPLWRVSLIAPQYPEGLGLLIRSNTVTGAKEGDLNSINGLNHYIGMKAIEPDAIPELRVMPAILATLAVCGLLVAAFARRWLLVTWASALGGFFLAGLADMWKWGYDYGHDLDPRAILKIPGMSYQPPLIGSKQLLNFHATSWPASGGWLLVLAGALTVAALYLSFRRRAHAALVKPEGGAPLEAAA